MGHALGVHLLGEDRRVGRAAPHGEVVAADDHRPPVDAAPAHHEVGRSELGELGALVGGAPGQRAHLVERPRVEQRVDALAHGEAARRVLTLHLLGPAHLARHRLAPVQLLDLGLPTLAHDMNAIGTARPASLAQRRDAATGLHRVLDPAEAVAEEAGRGVEVGHRERDAPEAGGPVAVGRRGADELEDHRAQTEEGLAHGTVIARATRLQAHGLQGAGRACQVGRGHHDVVDRDHTVGVRALGRPGRGRLGRTGGPVGGETVDAATEVDPVEGPRAQALIAPLDDEAHLADQAVACGVDGEAHLLPPLGLVGEDQPVERDAAVSAGRRWDACRGWPSCAGPGSCACSSSSTWRRRP